ncbi:MAG TPA: beta-ketoacyl synthase N-terminal-like domain-containing protein [Vicinamibacteria bacterium]|jgi:3-oxoacyl-[acyl-carrier-protein] synthase II|nr:beta-ketoacyl synthase N-terminal-like domain-containing protein [Vicinamibacteria bacterium]
MRDRGARVAVTGIGIVSAAGVGREAFWDAALAGRSAVSVMDAMKAVPFPGRVAGEVRGVDLGEYFANKKLLRMVGRRTFMSVAASVLMMRDARLELGAADADQIGIYLGDYGTFEDDVKGLMGALSRSTDERGDMDMRKFGTSGIKALNPLMLLINIPNAPTAHISMQHGLRGLGNTFLTDFIAAAQAIGEAGEVIRAGEASRMVAGGLALLTPLALLEYRALDLLCGEDVEPPRAVRPFDAAASGFAPGEGAVLLLLEDLDQARARGATVHAELAGYASTYEPSPDEISPDPDGLAISRAIEAALADAEIDPARVDCAIASGVAHPAFDRAEGRALGRLAAAAPRLKVTAVTPVTGHMQGAMTALQAGAACLALSSGAVPPVANLAERTRELSALPLVTGSPAQGPIETVVVSAVGMRGQAAALVLTRPAEILH